jgi:hypothetical protein
MDQRLQPLPESLLRSLQRIAQYLTESEAKDFESAPRRNHIYRDVLRLRHWLNKVVERSGRSSHS